jgi:hypothetical protein
MRPVTVGYIPPPSFTGASSFIENIQKNKISGDHFFMSDYVQYGFPIENCLRVSPEAHDGIRGANNEGQRRVRISNLVFLICLSQAARRGYTHMLYVESDCRFKGNGWDQVMFEEYFNLPFPAIAAGSVVAHSMINGGGQFYRRFTEYFRENSKGHLLPTFGIPTTTFMWREFMPGQPNIVPPGDMREGFRNLKPSLYPNGAIAIYDVAWLCEIFHLKPDGTFKGDHHAVEIVQWPAWDHVIGMALYDRFGADVFEVVAHLQTAWSSYGDVLSTEEERLQMLRDRKVKGVHQVKGEIAE